MKEKTASQITRYSFLLTVFVIWMHAGEALISSIPGQIAVPGFFILSGFLFFFSGGDKEEGPARIPAENAGTVPPVSSGEKKCLRKLLFPDWLAEKLKRRVRTLLIPYLLWNLIYYLICLVSGRADLKELPAAVFHYSCNPVFWYLFQLILIMCLTPVLNLVLKAKLTALGWLAAVLVCAVFYNEIHAATGADLINADALFYFSLGGSAARHMIRASGKEQAPADTAQEEQAPEGQEAQSREEVKRSLAAGLCCIGAMAAFMILRQYLPVCLWNISVIGVRAAGAFGCWFLTGLLRKIPVRPWMKITFFIYATHYCVIRAVWAAETAAGLNESAAANILVYLLMPAVCTAAAWALYKLMKKYTPKLLCMLTGGRG